MENNFKFYNTLTKKIETVIPHEDGKIAMYTCGPTVYHFAHIGKPEKLYYGRCSGKITSLCRI